MADDVNGGNGGSGNNPNAGDGNTGGANPGVNNGTGGANPAAPGANTVPETYEFKMPDGVELDKAAAGEFTALAKELKLGQDQAQKVAAIGASMMQRATQAIQDQDAAQATAWFEAAKTDKEFGGEKFEANAALAVKVVETYGTPGLKEALSLHGIGNHPELIRFMLKVGKAISEDGTFVPGGSKGADQDPAKRMFPTMN